MIKKVSFIVLFLILIAGMEIGARYYFGLGETATYIEDPQFEYIYSPSLAIRRFGNLIITNEYSMRSQALKQNERRILVFGDSVLNGGSLTNHSELATTLVENNLQQFCGEFIRVFNISAGSWGPDNAYAYLMKYGDFDASEIILVFSSHDAHDNMKHEKIVGLHPSFPSNQPYSALTDGFFRYFIPRIRSLFSKTKKEEFKKINRIDAGKEFNSGWKDFMAYSKSHSIKLLVVLHPNKNEVINGKYNSNGVKIIELLNDNAIPYILELDNRTTLKNYRDGIHYNENGQKFLSSEIYFLLQKDLCKVDAEKI